MTNRDKRAQHQYSLPCAGAVEITKWQRQQKQHVMFVLWKKKQYAFRSTWRDWDQLCARIAVREIHFWLVVTGSFWQHRGHEHYHYANYNQSKQFRNRSRIIIPVESAWHHVVVNELPFPPEVHWTVQLQDKIRPIFITLKVLGRKILLMSSTEILTSHTHYI